MKKLIWVLVLMAMVATVKAEVPKLINYSGKLTDKQGNVLEDKIYDIRFSLWTANTGGAEVWAEEHYNAQDRGVQTYGGGFNVVLGGTTALPEFEQNYWIEIRINIKGTDETFARQEMLSVPYAMRADDGTPKGAIIMWTDPKGTGECPCGYTRLNQFDGRFPRGAATYGATGGADSHSHENYTQDSDAHVHHLKIKSNGNDGYINISKGDGTVVKAAGYIHDHLVDGDTDLDGTHKHKILSDSNIPRFFNVIFCLKE
ncbi:hypothetical protein KAR10_03980 [bacterium]|nr:hypothetical protein [bacterium]